MAADLPRPTVDVTSRETDVGHEVDVVIHREGKARSFKGGGQGISRDGAVKDVIDRILGDHNSAEWIPRG